MTQFAHIDGHPVVKATVHVPYQGAWFADVVLADDTQLSGPVTLTIDAVEFSGTIDTRHAGAFGAQREMRIVAGANGWAKQLAAKDYASDGGVSARVIAEDAAREAGETLSTFTPSSERVGIQYVRSSGPASRVLENAIGSATWWVDYAGDTHVGTRSAVVTAESKYDVLEYAPTNRVAVLAVAGVSDVQIGSQIDGGIGETGTVRELAIEFGENLRVRAWLGAATSSRIVDAMRAIVDRMTDGKLFGLYKYRVTQMSGDRIELQAVKRAAGLPDLLPISAWPGVPGTSASLQPGGEVLVQFIEGDRTQPIVTHYAGKDGAGHVPVALVIGNALAALEAARKTDSVQVTVPAGTFLISAQAGVANPAPVTLNGQITSGSALVKIS